MFCMKTFHLAYGPLKQRHRYWVRISMSTLRPDGVRALWVTVAWRFSRLCSQCNPYEVKRMQLRLSSRTAWIYQGKRLPKWVNSTETLLTYHWAHPYDVRSRVKSQRQLIIRLQIKLKDKSVPFISWYNGTVRGLRNTTAPPHNRIQRSTKSMQFAAASYAKLAAKVD